MCCAGCAMWPLAAWMISLAERSRRRVFTGQSARCRGPLGRSGPKPCSNRLLNQAVGLGDPARAVAVSAAEGRAEDPCSTPHGCARNRPDLMKAQIQSSILALAEAPGRAHLRLGPS